MTARLETLSKNLQKLYDQKGKDLLFHGWHHIYLVSKKALEFADELGVDRELIEATALVHDLNYVAEVRSEPEAGKELRTQCLKQAGFTTDEIETIEQIVMEAHTATRHADISDAAKVLSDADSVFKVMPLTTVILAGKYITEQKVDIQQWADKIIAEQKPLHDKGIYFYTETAKRRYLHWAKTNMEVVLYVDEAMQDPVIKETWRIAREAGII